MIDTRTRLLDAATHVLLTTGAERLTLGAVAAEARVSKGGLFYHFPTKQALVAAMIERLVGQFDDALLSASDEPGAATRAYLDNTVEAASTAAGTGVDRATSALLAAAVVDPAALVPLRESYRRWQERLQDDGIDPAAATAVRLAVDGWWLARLLDLAPPPPGLHERTRALLATLIDEG